MGKKKIRQYVKKMYREIELCPGCKTPMKRTGIVYPVQPPCYGWECPKCKRAITSSNSGEIQFVLGKKKYV